MNTKPFDPNKPYQCRDGCKAKIVDEAFNGGIIYIKTVSSGLKLAVEVYKTGLLQRDYTNNDDLINIPEKKMLDIWMNVYPDYTGMVHASKGAADEP